MYLSDRVYWLGMERLGPSLGVFPVAPEVEQVFARSVGGNVDYLPMASRAVNVLGIRCGLGYPIR